MAWQGSAVYPDPGNGEVVDHYRIYTASTRDGDYIPLDTITVSGRTSSDQIMFEHTDLRPLTTYYYRISACETAEPGSCSSLSSPVSATTTPAVPTGLTARAVSASAIELSWDSVLNAVAYRLTESGAGTIATLVGSTTYTHTGLQPGVTNSYTISACTLESGSNCSEESISVGATTAPGAPGRIAASVAGRSINLTWQDVATAVSYEIWRGTQADGSDRILITGGAGQPAHPTASAYRDTGLLTTTAYYYWLRACDSRLCSDYSTVVSARYVNIRLNDTGIVIAGNVTGNSPDCTSDIAAPQDCDQGRDAAVSLNKVGAGAVGFDFTKLAADGTALANQTVAWSDSGSEAANSQWACVRDNNTGLVWEVKTDNSTPDIHDKDTTYRWGGATALGHDSDASGKGDYHSDWDSLVTNSNSGNGLCGATNWRVPTIAELATIVHRGRSAPTIDTDLFANNPSSFIWSASPRASQNTHAWGVNFGQGVVTSIPRGSNAGVRLVSGLWAVSSEEEVATASGQTHIAWSINYTPNSRYTVSSDGTVTDNDTGLMWKQCAEGLSGSTCTTGVADTLAWQAALGRATNSTFAEYNDWRLPDLEELRSIVAYDRHTPSINAATFPATGGVIYWSSSPNVANGTDSLGINLNHGVDVSAARSATHQVRLVRTASGRTTPAAVPEAPTLTAGSNHIVITWDAVPGASWYRLYSATPADVDSAYTVLASSSETAYTDRDLMPLTQYHYRIVACLGSAPESCAGQSATASITTTVAVPADFSATLDSTATTLTWQPVANALHYEIWRGVNAHGNDRTLVSGIPGQPPHPLADAATYSDANINPTFTYYYWIRACTALICSDYSPVAGPIGTPLPRRALQRYRHHPGREQRCERQ